MPKLTIKKEGLIDYVEILPDGYDQSKKYGLVVFLHGIDGRISIDYLLQKEIPIEVQAWANLRSLIILCPQTQTQFGEQHFIAMQKAANALPLNSIRLITGLSFGGGAVLYLLSIPGVAAYFQAAVIVCGIFGVQGCEIANSKIPILFFHGGDDPIVNITAHGLKNYNAIISCGGKPLFITLPVNYHWIWGHVYNPENWYPIEEGKPNQPVIDWMLSKTVQAAPTPAPAVIANIGADFTTSDPSIKLESNFKSNEKYDFAWEVLSHPEGNNQNKWNVLKGTGWFFTDGILRNPGSYKFRFSVLEKGSKKVLATDDVTVTYTAQPVTPSKPVEAEGEINGKRYKLFTDKTWE